MFVTGLLNYIWLKICVALYIYLTSRIFYVEKNGIILMVLIGQEIFVNPEVLFFFCSKYGSWSNCGNSTNKPLPRGIEN